MRTRIIGNRKTMPTGVMARQALAVRQAFESLLTIARLRQHELEAGIRDAKDVDTATALRVELNRTRTALARAEILR